MTSEELKRELERIATEGVMTQALLVGLMNALVQKGVDRQVCEDAFDYTAQVLIAGSSLMAHETRFTDALPVLEQLRKSLVGHDGPKHVV